MAFMSALHIGSFDSSSDGQGSLRDGAERSERAALKACRSLPAKRRAIAAACAADWGAAEKHHLMAIHQADTAPYKHLQPLAREWYAAMLLERGGRRGCGQGARPAAGSNPPVRVAGHELSGKAGQREIRSAVR